MPSSLSKKEQLLFRVMFIPAYLVSCVLLTALVYYIHMMVSSFLLWLFETYFGSLIGTTSFIANALAALIIGMNIFRMRERLLTDLRCYWHMACGNTSFDKTVIPGRAKSAD